MQDYWSYREEERDGKWVVVGLLLTEDYAQDTEVLWEGPQDMAEALAQALRTMQTKQVIRHHRSLKKDIEAPCNCKIPALRKNPQAIFTREPPPCCGQ